MKKSTCIMACLLFTVISFSQNPLSFNSESTTLQEAFNQLEEAGYSLSYGNGFNKNQTIQLKTKEISPEVLLVEIKQQSLLDFKTTGKSVTFYPKSNSQKSSELITVTGIIRDSKTNEPIIGATIYDVGSKTGLASDQDGKFILNGIPPLSLRISYIGYLDTLITIAKTSSIVIKLEASSSVFSEVVIKGTNPNHNVISTEVSVEKLNIQQIKTIPII